MLVLEKKPKNIRISTEPALLANGDTELVEERLGKAVDCHRQHRIFQQFPVHAERHRHHASTPPIALFSPVEELRCQQHE